MCMKFQISFIRRWVNFATHTTFGCFIASHPIVQKPICCTLRQDKKIIIYKILRFHIHTSWSIQEMNKTAALATKKPKTELSKLVLYCPNKIKQNRTWGENFWQQFFQVWAIHRESPKFWSVRVQTVCATFRTRKTLNTSVHFQQPLFWCRKKFDVHMQSLSYRILNIFPSLFPKFWLLQYTMLFSCEKFSKVLPMSVHQSKNARVNLKSFAHLTLVAVLPWVIL